jgi:hypothetical protein
MKLFYIVVLLQLVNPCLTAKQTSVGKEATGEGPTQASAATKASGVVRKLYRQVVLRRPLGIPTGENKVAIWPFLSSGLIRQT